MTGPQTITLWTPERANRALPLVRRIADDLVRTYDLWRKLVAQFELVSIGVTPAATSEAERLQREVQRAAGDIEDFMTELTELGVECKSLENGLFDFPCEREGRIVYLCWLHGERTVSHWHEVDAGFAGRQPIE
jgi:hypothetical protein